MAYVFDSGDAFRIVVMGVAALIGLGASVAWIPAIKFDSMIIPARLLLAGTAIVIALGNPVTVVLGIALAAVALMLWWQTQAVPEVPRPHLLSVVMIASITGAAAFAALSGWSAFGRLPDAGRGVAAVVVAGVGALAVLAAADRSRVRLREAINRRFSSVDIQLVPAASGDSVFTGVDDDQPAMTSSSTIETDATQAVPQQREGDDYSITVEQMPETNDEPAEAAEPEAAGKSTADEGAAGETADEQPADAETATDKAAVATAEEQQNTGDEPADESASQSPADSTVPKQKAREHDELDDAPDHDVAESSNQKPSGPVPSKKKPPGSASSKQKPAGRQPAKPKSRGPGSAKQKSTEPAKRQASAKTSSKKAPAKQPTKKNVTESNNQAAKNSTDETTSDNDTDNSSPPANTPAESSVSNGQSTPNESKAPATNKSR